MKKIHLIAITIIAVAVMRLFPHLPNMAPTTALAVYLGYKTNYKEAIFFTLIARLSSDLLIGLFNLPLMVMVYACHIAGVLVGMYIKKNSTSKLSRIFAGSVGTSLVFFFLTSLVFFYQGMYPLTIQGQVSSYINALPFLLGTFLGDFMYTSILFGVDFAYETLTSKSKSQTIEA